MMRHISVAAIVIVCCLFDFLAHMPSFGQDAREQSGWGLASGLALVYAGFYFWKDRG